MSLLVSLLCAEKDYHGRGHIGCGRSVRSPHGSNSIHCYRPLKSPRSQFSGPAHTDQQARSALSMRAFWVCGDSEWRKATTEWGPCLQWSLPSEPQAPSQTPSGSSLLCITPRPRIICWSAIPRTVKPRWSSARLGHVWGAGCYLLCMAEG